MTKGDCWVRIPVEDGVDEECPQGGGMDEEGVGVSRGYTDYHQGRAIHMADSRIH